MRRENLGETLDRKRRIGLDISPPRFARLARCVEQCLLVGELGHHPVERLHALFSPLSSPLLSPCSSSTSSRISKIESARSTRTKTRKRNAKRPTEPTSVVTSQPVGRYGRHAEGRKSWARLETTIISRS